MRTLGKDPQPTPLPLREHAGNILTCLIELLCARAPLHYIFSPLFSPSSHTPPTRTQSYVRARFFHLATCMPQPLQNSVDYIATVSIFQFCQYPNYRIKKVTFQP